VPNRWSRLKDDIDYALKRKHFLKHQFSLANSFLKKYHNELSNDQLTTIKNFIKLEGRNYLLQRIKRRNAHL
jgi:hypothetical protein